METPQPPERLPLEFKDTLQATNWTLDQLDRQRKKTRWPLKNKYQKAKAALAQGNWQLSRDIIKQEYESASDVLENSRIDVALRHPQETVPQSAPIVKNATYFAILLNLIDQQIRLGSDFTTESLLKKQIVTSLETDDRLLAARESQLDFVSYSIPQALTKLSALAPEVFKV